MRKKRVGQDQEVPDSVRLHRSLLSKSILSGGLSRPGSCTGSETRLKTDSEPSNTSIYLTYLASRCEHGQTALYWHHSLQREHFNHARVFWTFTKWPILLVKNHSFTNSKWPQIKTTQSFQIFQIFNWCSKSSSFTNLQTHKDYTTNNGLSFRWHLGHRNNDLMIYN